MSGSEKEKGRWYNIQIESSKGPAVPGNNLRMKEYKFGYFDTFFFKNHSVILHFLHLLLCWSGKQIREHW